MYTINPDPVTTNQVNIHIQKKQNIGHGRIQLKIKESDIKLDQVDIDGEKFKIVKRMTRGRYIVKPLEVTA